MTLLLAAVFSLMPWPQLDKPAFDQTVHYRLAVHGAPGEAVQMSGSAGKGWLVSFCTAHFCSLDGASITLSRSGAEAIDVQVVRVDPDVPPRTRLTVRGLRQMVTADVRLRRH